jgi:hypothetical protein
MGNDPASAKRFRIEGIYGLITPGYKRELQDLLAISVRGGLNEVASPESISGLNYLHSMIHNHRARSGQTP